MIRVPFLWVLGIIVLKKKRKGRRCWTAFKKKKGKEEESTEIFFQLAVGFDILFVSLDYICSSKKIYCWTKFFLAESPIDILASSCPRPVDTFW